MTICSSYLLPFPVFHIKSHWRVVVLLVVLAHERLPVTCVPHGRTSDGYMSVLFPILRNFFDYIVSHLHEVCVGCDCDNRVSKAQVSYQRRQPGLRLVANVVAPGLVRPIFRICGLVFLVGTLDSSRCTRRLL
jgi:hypothetical protein